MHRNAFNGAFRGLHVQPASDLTRNRQEVCLPRVGHCVRASSRQRRVVEHAPCGRAVDAGDRVCPDKGRVIQRLSAGRHSHAQRSRVLRCGTNPARLYPWRFTSPRMHALQVRISRENRRVYVFRFQGEPIDFDVCDVPLCRTVRSPSSARSTQDLEGRAPGLRRCRRCEALSPLAPRTCPRCSSLSVRLARRARFFRPVYVSSG